MFGIDLPVLLSYRLDGFSVNVKPRGIIDQKLAA